MRLQDHPPPSIMIPSSPAIEVAALIEDYASGDKGGVTTALSPTCRRQIDFVIKPYMPKAPQLPVHEELQQEHAEAVIEVPPSIPPVNSSSILSLDPTIVQNVSRSVESISPANV